MDENPAAVSFANPDSFLPAYASSEWVVNANVPEALWVYWDDQAYPAEYSSVVEQQRANKKALEEKADQERKAKLEEENKRKKETKKGLKENMPLTFFWATDSIYSFFNSQGLAGGRPERILCRYGRYFVQ